jgi:hemoglobin
MDGETLFDRAGGQSFFDALVDAFYDGVETDVLLRPMYVSPLTEARHHLALFLAQYWGGPTTYGDERGHPRLRMRHAPFPITREARDAWILHMDAALSRTGDHLLATDRADLSAYLHTAARQLQNL